MTDLTNKVFQILKEFNIQDENIETELLKINSEIQENLCEKLIISPTILYKLRDTIFLNFEYSQYHDSITGKSSLKHYGKHYPVFMLNITSNYIPKEYIENIFNELKEIKSKWNDQIYVADLYSKGEFDWRIGENASELIVYNKDNESPTKYGYYNNNSYGKIYDSNGAILKKSQEIVLCSITKMDIYREYNLLTQALNNLYLAIEKAHINNKCVFLDFDNYNYE